MAKNPSKALPTQEAITDVALQRVVWPENKWSEADPTREPSSSPTRRSTTTLCPPTGTLSPEPPARRPPQEAAPAKPTNPLARLRCRRRVYLRPLKRWRMKMMMSLMSLIRWLVMISLRVWRNSPKHLPEIGSPTSFRGVWRILGWLKMLQQPLAAIADTLYGGCFFNR